MTRRALQIILLILAFSVIAGFILYYVVGFTAKKSAWVAGGAGVAMIIFDILIPLVRRRSTGWGK